MGADRQLAAHGVIPEEFERFVHKPESEERRKGTSEQWEQIEQVHLPIGRYLACVYDKLDDVTLLPITAYEVEP